MPKSYKGDWEPNKREPNDLDRSLAMDRAMIMSQLFQLEKFSKIVKIINMPNVATKKQDFLNACGADITLEQKNWLWNYLKEYKEPNNWVGTGW